MHLTNPWALWFLPLAALPVIIHLFRQRQANRVPFPDLRFLKESRTATWRSARLKEWLLLALRVLAVACIVLAMARPLADITLPAWLGGSEGLVVIVIDDSASMAARDGDGTLFDTAKRRAGEAVAQLAGNSRVAVISASTGHEVASGFVAPALAGQRIAALRQGDRGTDIPGAVRAADALLAQQGGKGLIVLVSDLQRTAFGDLRPLPRLSPGAAVRLVDVSPARPAGNLIWENVTASSLRQRILVTARIAGGVRPLIKLERQGRVYYAQQAAPGKDGEAAVSFGWPDADSLTLTCSGDGNALDDTFYLPSRRQRYGCLLLADSGAAFLRKALQAMAPGGFATVSAENPASDQVASADLIVVARDLVPQGLGQRVAGRVRDGAAVLAVPPLRADAASYNAALLAPLGLPQLAGLARRDSGAASALKLGPGADALGGDIAQRDLATAAISACWKPGDGDPGAPLFCDGRPALVLRGRTALWLFGAQPEMNALVFKPLFVVLLHRLAARLVDGAAGAYDVGAALRPDPGQQLFLPDGSTAPREGSAGAVPLAQRGWYRLTGFGSQRLLAANIPAAESDPARIDQADLAGVLRNVPWHQSAGRSASSSPLLAVLVALCLIALAAEAIIRRS
ncbi:MAG TPA: BatA and WFA domain-containing protein [Candidatus Edwardsbacteria bacterium]|nr:BatA and WFA domain-containing protein [Candidatus Edwardsbacteria bacterium]